MTDQANLYSWDDAKTYEESNKVFVLPPADMGYVLRIDHIGEPRPSQFTFKDPKTGEDQPPRIQARIAFTIVDYLNNDQLKPEESPIGQTVFGYFTLSMHTKSNLYSLVKNAFGGDVDPRWKPNKADLEGKLVSAVLGHKNPNSEGKVYAKVEKFVPYRGPKDIGADVPVWEPKQQDDDGDDPPF